MAFRYHLLNFALVKSKTYKEMKNYLFLCLAILAEAIGTTALKTSEQFTRPLPAVITVVAYVAAFYFLGLSLKTIPIGIAYAIWAAAGIVIIAIIGAVWFKQTPDLPAVIGIALIIAGVLTINLFSKMEVH